MNDGVHIKRHDMNVRHEEADVIIVNHVALGVEEGYKTIHVICDDTDVFVLSHFYMAHSMTIDLFMMPTSHGRKITNIGASIRKHRDIVPHLKSLHALTRCNSC